MITRTIQFDGSEQSKTYFRLLFEAFRSRGSALAEKRVDKAEKRSEAKILRGMKSISEPFGDAPKDGELDVRPLQLKKAGELTLEQPEFSRLQKFVEETQWLATMTDVAADLEDWLDATAKTETKESDAK